MKFDVDICNTAWTIIITDDISMLTVKNKLCKGAVHYKDETIYISNELNSKDLMKVILHEITHVVLYETQIELKEFYTEEDLCELMAKYGEYITSNSNIIFNRIKKGN